MPRRYDRPTMTVYDAETGASVATIHVPDNGSFEEAHRIGYLMAAAEGMQEALAPFAELVSTMTVQDALSFKLIQGKAAELTITRGFTKEIVDAEIFDVAFTALRAAEPPR